MTVTLSQLRNLFNQHVIAHFSFFDNSKWKCRLMSMMFQFRSHREKFRSFFRIIIEGMRRISITAVCTYRGVWLSILCYCEWSFPPCLPSLSTHHKGMDSHLSPCSTPSCRSCTSHLIPSTYKVTLEWMNREGLEYFQFRRSSIHGNG